MDIIETMDSFKCVIDKAKEEISEKLAKMFIVNDISDIKFDKVSYLREIPILSDILVVTNVYLVNDEVFVNGYSAQSDATMTFNLKSLPFESLQELVFMVQVEIDKQ